MSLTNDEVDQHLALVEYQSSDSTASSNPLLEQLRTTPLFSSAINSAVNSQPPDPAGNTVLPQYGLLGLRTAVYEETDDDSDGSRNIRCPRDNLVYANVNAPWSTFICGSQGSGKSHTLSCMLENSLLSPSITGKVSSMLTGLVLHYDKFTGFDTGQLCEAAYLCSSNIPVRVLVSPSNYERMSRLYSNLPGLPESCPRPVVKPLKFREDHLSIAMMKSLMSAGSGESTPLYMELVVKILRDMATVNQSRRGINLQEFKMKLQEQSFIKGQSAPLQMRLNLLESFLDTTSARSRTTVNTSATDVWQFKKGTLTIIDLSCPFVDEDDACALFNICLGIFLENRNQAGRIIALDEAHKFLTTKSGDAVTLTETMLSLIRQQRHLATRVIIATQEPTLSPNLLDLCNVTIVHRFTSPAWYKTLKEHLAGAVIGRTSAEQSKSNSDGIFSRVVHLKTGEALVFCPSAIMDLKGKEAVVSNTSEDGEVVEYSSMEESSATSTESLASGDPLAFKELGGCFFKLKVRKRVTTDGGRSILAQ